MFKDVDYAWAAGFIDGEGSFQIMEGSRANCYGRMLAYNSSRLPLDKLVNLFGGTVFRVDGKHETHSDAYRWAIYGIKACNAAISMLPYLTVKLERAELFVEFQSSIHRKYTDGVPTDIFTKRHELRKKMQLLNQRGIQSA